MARGPSTFKQRDVTAAIKAAVAAGVEVARVEVGSDGKIVVITGKPVAQPHPTTSSETDMGL